MIVLTIAEQDCGWAAVTVQCVPVSSLRDTGDLSVMEETSRLPAFLAGVQGLGPLFLGESCCWDMQCRTALRLQELQRDCVAP